MRWWEEILRLAPGDATALDALAAGYERLGRSDDLARVLEQQISQAGQDPAVQAAGLRRLAQLAEGKLADPARAQRAWEELLRATPSDPRGAGGAVAHLRRQGRLAHAGRRARAAHPAGGRHRQAAVALALERARIFEEELRIRSEAMAALEQIVERAGPALPAGVRAAAPAGRGGRRLGAGGGGGREAAVPRGGSQTPRPTGRWRSACCGAIAWTIPSGPWPPSSGRWRSIPTATEALTALARAVHPGRRVAAADPHRREAAGSAGAGRPRRRAGALAADVRDRRDRRSAPGRCQDWRSSGTAAPTTRAPTRRRWPSWRTWPSATQLWDELVQVYEGARARATDPAGQVAIARKIAGIVETALGDPGRAFAGLREALAAEPAATTLLPELERLAEAADEWDGLLEVYAQVARHRPRSRRAPGAAAQAGRGARAAAERSLRAPWTSTCARSR